jgi:hypothetical protein
VAADQALYVTIDFASKRQLAYLNAWLRGDRRKPPRSKTERKRRISCSRVTFGACFEEERLI